MNKKESTNRSKPDMDILSEFEGVDREIAEHIMSHRQTASPALRQRVMDITRKPVRVERRWIPQGVLRRALALTLIGLLILVLPFALPEVRASAAQLLRLLQSADITSVVSPGADSFITLSPTPIFTVRQPGVLPDGFARTVVYYRSHLQMLITEQALEASSNFVLAARLEAYATDNPYLLIGYRAADSQYVLLFQRAAVENEALPPGSPLTIDEYPGSLRTENGVLILTWIADDTWINLETNTNESNLIETAQGLIVTQQTEDIAPTAPEAANLPLCEGENVTSQRNLLGIVDDQTFWGSLWVYLYEHDVNSESVAYGLYSEGVTVAMLFQRGLDALRDPRLAGQALSAPLDTVFETSADQKCLEPDSDLSGYVVLEIWEQQVNAAFVGTDSDLRERAIHALEIELAK